MEPQTPKHRGQEEKEIDLGILISYVGRSVKKLSSGIAAFFVFLFDCLINLLLFIKRKFVYILIGALVGLVAGIFVYNKRGAIYSAQMVVRTNFESSRSLYSKIEYFNALITQGRYQELASMFQISESEAANLQTFTIYPIDNEMEKARLYRDNFLNYNKSDNAYQDSEWSKTVKYRDFKDGLSAFDYPLHQINLRSHAAAGYSKISAAIARSLNSNETLHATKLATDSTLKLEEHILLSSLASLDSMKKAYSRRIASAAETPGETQRFVFADKSAKNPEVDLFDKELVLKDELTNVRKKEMQQSDIIQVFADFNDVGTPVSKLSHPYVAFPFWGAVIALAIVIIIEIIRKLNAIDRKRSGIK